MPEASSDFGESSEFRNPKRGKVVASDLRKITVRYTNTLQSYTHFKSFLIHQGTVLMLQEAVEIKTVSGKNTFC